MKKIKRLKEDRKRHFLVQGNLYKQEILFCFNMTNEEAFKILKKTSQGVTKEDENNILGDKEHDSDGVVGTTYTLARGYLILLKWPKNAFRRNISLALHEILHVTNSVMDKVNIPFSKDTDHAYIYLAEYYLKEFLLKLY